MTYTSVLIILFITRLPCWDPVPTLVVDDVTIHIAADPRHQDKFKDAPCCTLGK